MVFGALISLAPSEYRSALIGLMGSVVLSLTTIIAYQHLRRQRSGEREHAAN